MVKTLKETVLLEANLRDASRVIFAKRFWQLFFTVTRFALSALADVYLGRQTESNSTIKASRIRQAIVELGPTCIKVGQMLSSRSDLIPLELHKELSKLQDQTEPVAFDIADQVIQLDFGLPTYRLFRSFEKTPIASASIAQVHKAMLPDGTKVAVKIQRPGIRSAFEDDIFYLIVLGRVSQALGTNYQTESLVGMLAEIKEMFLSELDFLAEGRNQEEIRRFFRPKPEIIVPKVYWSHSSPHVLTMEYVESEKISDFALREKSKSKRKAVVARLLEYYLEQIFKNDIYHCDPHPGNIGIAKSGALVVYDYGAVGKLKKERVEQLSKSLKAFLNNDLDGFIKALEKLGLLDLSVNREKKVALLSKVFEPVLSFYHGKSSEHNYDLKGFEADFGQLLLEENTFCLPPDLCGVLRSITSLEGVLRMLQPDINIPKALVPFVKDWLVEEGLEQGQKRKVGKK